MTVGDLVRALDLKPFSAADDTLDVAGGYAGDLLSWVMGRAQKDQVWITIMSNQNIIAVATLAETSMIILSESVQPDPGVIDLAKARGINLYGSDLATFDLAVRIGAML